MAIILKPKMKYYKLDNPVWNSLSETHKSLAIEYDGTKFYKPQYCPFGGFKKIDKLDLYIDKYSNLTDNFFIVGEKPVFNDNIIVVNNLLCSQMILNTKIDFEINEEIVELKSEKHKLDLFDLVCLVYPGFFMTKTADLGKYFGIYKNNKLIAVTGERLKMNEFTEVSAVVTHPDYIRKGYAKQLIAHTSNYIFDEGKTPYLHVAETNIRAIKLYEKMGFKMRKKISFWNLKKRTTNNGNE